MRILHTKFKYCSLGFGKLLLAVISSAGLKCRTEQLVKRSSNQESTAQYLSLNGHTLRSTEVSFTDFKVRTTLWSIIKKYHRKVLLNSLCLSGNKLGFLTDGSQNLYIVVGNHI